ncbi:Ssl1-domain-containing protein [Lactarius indigo]|nr:Ssl1-domain-containing protein [Lactarius indigo]
MNSGSDSDSFDEGDLTARGRKAKGKSGSRANEKGKQKAKDQGYAWEATYARSWDTVQEDEAGSLTGAVAELLARGRRRRALSLGFSLRQLRSAARSFRHLVLLLDLSAAMSDRDMRPTRFDLSLEYAREFITEWFDQNPLGQIGYRWNARWYRRARVRDRGGTGNPQDVLKAISERHKLEPIGEPSLQNAIEMARIHLPTHSSREMLVIFGSLTTVDPGNIYETLSSCVKDRIRISLVALAAETKICRELCDKTGGTFGVAMNEGHFKDLLFELIPPPAQQHTGTGAGGKMSADLMMMGFPQRLPDTAPAALCVCHAQMRAAGFLCPRCGARLCDAPTDCDVCGLMIRLVSASRAELSPLVPRQAVFSRDNPRRRN